MKPHQKEEDTSKATRDTQKTKWETLFCKLLAQTLFTEKTKKWNINSPDKLMGQQEWTKQSSFTLYSRKKKMQYPN